MKDLRIAVVVCNVMVGKTQKNLDDTETFAKKARAAGADLICFPEMNISGYSNHPDILEFAQSIPGPASNTLKEIAVSQDILVMAGLAEKGGDGRMYATHLMAMPNGDLGIYRKCHIAPPEKNIYSPGDTVPTFEFNECTFGVQLCYDAHFPELSTSMVLKGAEILFFPHASPRGLAIEKHRSWMRHLTARAFDNSVYVIACNQTGYNGKGLTFPGNAVVINPAGNIMAQSLSSRETMMVVDLQASLLQTIRKNRMHYFLPNRRPELYKL